MPVTYDEIAALAYQLWKERGEPIGSPQIDWERAETTLEISAVTLVKTAVSESEPKNLDAGGAGDELLAEKTASVAAERDEPATEPQESPASQARAKATRRRNLGTKQSSNGTPAS